MISKRIDDLWQWFHRPILARTLRLFYGIAPTYAIQLSSSPASLARPRSSHILSQTILTCLRISWGVYSLWHGRILGSWLVGWFICWLSRSWDQNIRRFRVQNKQWNPTTSFGVTTKGDFLQTSGKWHTQDFSSPIHWMDDKWMAIDFIIWMIPSPSHPFIHHLFNLFISSPIHFHLVWSKVKLTCVASWPKAS